MGNLKDIFMCSIDNMILKQNVDDSRCNFFDKDYILISRLYQLHTDPNGSTDAHSRSKKEKKKLRN
jgi:hypothetical protein